MTETQALQNITTHNQWLTRLCHTRYPFAKKMRTPPQMTLLHQLTMRIPTQEKTKFGEPKPQRRRFDGLAIVKPFYSAYQEDILTVAIEIKTAKADLLNDEKYKESIGYTHYYLFATPTELIPYAKQKLEKTGIGLVDANKGTLIIQPTYQQIPPHKHLAIFCEFSARQNFDKAKTYENSHL